MIRRNFAEIIWLFFFLFVIVSLAPALLMKSGQDDLAKGIHSVYRIFCHQRVERSPFFFGAENFVTFHTVEELKYYGAIPEINPYAPAGFEETYFAYPFIGDEVVGFKTALCIRDLSIYSTVVLFGGIYLLFCRKNRKIYKFDWKIALLLMLPLAVDGLFQLSAEIAGWDWVPQSYFDNQLKRIITGFLFGIGLVMLTFPLLKENDDLLYNNGNKDDKELGRENQI